jgi:hypothetical protein
MFTKPVYGLVMKEKEFIVVCQENFVLVTTPDPYSPLRRRSKVGRRLAGCM